MFKEPINVLDAGVVKLIDGMGDDYSIIRAARVSTGTAEKVNEAKDRGLISYLYRNEHMTPFEMAVRTFYVKAPLFVVQQILRHRTFSFNQASQRYKEFEPECFYPETYRMQDAKNKQHSYEDKEFNKKNKNDYDEVLTEYYKLYSDIYENMCEDGIAREQARIVTPSSQYTELYFTADLRSILHFLELRMHPHAQKEIQDYARAIYQILMNDPGIKWTMEIFNEIYDLKLLMHRASNMDRKKLKQYLFEFVENPENNVVKT